jgi:HEAT repeat protein
MVERDRDRLFAARALREAGPAAEEPAASLLNSRSETVRREACRILEAVGTAATLPRLAPLAKDPDPLVRAAAQAAAAAIRRRQNP